jgi:hypothetical protein
MSEDSPSAGAAENGVASARGRFPDDWPDGCPPDDADDASGEIFRLVKTNPPTVGDLQTHKSSSRVSGLRGD